MPDSSVPWPSPDLAAKFLQNVRDAIPLSIEQIDTMLQLLAAGREEPLETFLDLGCGDGMLSAAILDENRSARACLVDYSEAALSGAREQLEPFKERVEFIVADYAEPAWVRSLARGRTFDAVVSGFAAQHVRVERKRALFAEIFQLLKPEGIFIDIEHVASATRWTESVWDDCTIDAIFGQELRADADRSRAEVAREYFARAIQQAGALAPLEVQCDWLRELGFENVDCYHKVLELAVFGGQRPA
jgi:ubiquinone/menaquinone biosynthesis C-methylase UbiE